MITDIWQGSEYVSATSSHSLGFSLLFAYSALAPRPLKRYQESKVQILAICGELSLHSYSERW